MDFAAGSGVGDHGLIVSLVDAIMVVAITGEVYKADRRGGEANPACICVRGRDVRGRDVRGRDVRGRGQDVGVYRVQWLAQRSRAAERVVTAANLASSQRGQQRDRRQRGGGTAVSATRARSFHTSVSASKKIDPVFELPTRRSTRRIGTSTT